jgi:hypothetical protein
MIIFKIFLLFHLNPIENTFLEITDKNGNIIFKTDSIIGLPAGTGINILNAEVIFAGFGWSDDKTGYSDFNGIDVRGKVVMFAMGTPESFKTKDLSRWNNSLETDKIKKAIEAGAALVIIINNPLDEGNSIYNRMNRWINRNDFSLETPDKNRKQQFCVFNFLNGRCIAWRKRQIQKASC